MVNCHDLVMCYTAGMANGKQGPNRLPNGTFAPGHSGNPRGRPQNSLRAELKRQGDPAKIAAIVIGWINDESMPTTDRKWAMEFYANRLYGKPTTVIDAAIHNTGDQDDDTPLTDAQFAMFRSMLQIADAPDDGATEH